MEKTNRIIQVYGYTICVVAVITFLITAANSINAVIDLGDPLYALSGRYNNDPNLASYDTYKVDIIKSLQQEKGDTTESYIPDEQTMRGMYEAAKADRIQAARHLAKRTLITSGILMVLSVILFAVHWIWMKRSLRTVT